MWWIILIIYILGYLGSLTFLGAVNEKDGKFFFVALFWPIILSVFLIFIFLRSFYILGRFFHDEQEDFYKYWRDHILEI